MDVGGDGMKGTVGLLCMSLKNCCGSERDGFE